MLIKHQLTAGFFVLVIFLSLVCTASFYVNGKTRRGLQKIAESTEVEDKAVSRLVEGLFHLQITARDLLITSFTIGKEDSEALLPPLMIELKTRMAEVDKALIKARQGARTGLLLRQGDETQSEKETDEVELTQLTKIDRDFHLAVADLNIFMEKIQSDPKQAAEILSSIKKGRFSQNITPFLVKYKTNTEQELASDTNKAIEKVTLSGYIVLFSNLFILLLFSGYSVSLSLGISRPIRALLKAAQAIGRGELNTNIALNTKNELGILASTLNKMASDLSKTTVSKDQLDSVFEGMANIVLVLDAEGRVISANKYAFSLLEYSKEELIGLPFSSIAAIGDPETDSLLKLVRAEKSISTMELSFQSKSHVVIPVLLSASLISGKASQAADVVCVAQDTSEKKKLEIELFRAQKLESIGQLAAGIAHEMNTPIQYVGDNLSYLKDTLDGVLDAYKNLYDGLKNQASEPSSIQIIKKMESVPDFDDFLTEIPLAISQSIEGINRVSHIVRSMKEFSHPGSAGKSSCDINRAIETTSTIAKNEWKYVADLELNLDPALPLVFANLNDINQVLLNLIVNAAHAIGSHSPHKSGKISISTKRKNSDVEIRIEDTGGGIPKNIQTKIFDPFFTTKELGKGTGQGLSMAHTIIVERHHGQLNFETLEGTGTAFVIMLPIETLN
jgi:PAS domain S-box-containing protein